jgi:hypothetical protein
MLYLLVSKMVIASEEMRYAPSDDGKKESEGRWAGTSDIYTVVRADMIESMQ